MDGLNISSNGELECNCPEGFRKDDNNQTCILKTLCNAGDIGRIECEKRSAKCVMDENKLGEFYCECPEGKIFPDGKHISTPEEHNSSCISLCDLHGKENNCSAWNGKCNPWKLQNIQNPTGPHSIEDYCDCSPGYFMATDKKRTGCILATYSANLKLIIKNTFHYPKNLGIASVLPNYYRSPSKSILRKKRQVKFLENNYKIDEEGFYSAKHQEYILNSQIDELESRKLDKYRFVDEMRTKFYEILETIEIIDSKEKVGIKKCEIMENQPDYYECEIVVVLSKHYDSEKSVIDGLKGKCSEIPHSNNPDICFFIYNQLFINTKQSFETDNYKVFIQKSIIRFKTKQKFKS